MENKQENGVDAVDHAQFSRISFHKKESVNSCPAQLARVSRHDADVCHVSGGECNCNPEDLDSEESGCDPAGYVMSHKAKKRKKKHKEKWKNLGDMEDSILGTRLNLSELMEAQPVGAGGPPQNSLNENITERLSVKGEKVKDMEPVPVEANKLPDVPDKLIHETDLDVMHNLGHNEGDKPMPTGNGSVSRVSMEKSGPESCTWPVVKGLAFPLVGLLLYFWDIGSDIRLAVEYKKNGDLTRFGITVGCIVIPHVIMAVVDVSWVYIDRRKQKSSRREGECVESWSKRFVLGFLTLGRIVRSVTYMHHVFEAKKLPKDDTATRQTSPLAKSPQNGAHVSETYENGSYSSDMSPQKRREWHKARAREEKRDCFMLDFINAFAESAPQLFVQLYLYYRYDLPLTIVRGCL